MEDNQDMRSTLYRWHRQVGKDRFSCGAIDTSEGRLVVWALLLVGEFILIYRSPDLGIALKQFLFARTYLQPSDCRLWHDGVK